jgi:Concanavalin A-like lectin/glucanases superfamily
MKAAANNPLNYFQGLVTGDFYDLEISDGINFAISTDHGASFAETKNANGGHGPFPSSGEWHYIVGTYDGRKLQLYVDGAKSGNPFLTGGNISPMLPDSFISFGSEDGRTCSPDCIGTRYFNGLIDEVKFYNRALSADEIKANYDSLKNLPPAK